MVCAAVRLPAAQMMFDYISNQINGPFFFFIFFLLLLLDIAAASPNDGKNKNLSFVYHLLFSHLLCSQIDHNIWLRRKTPLKICEKTSWASNVEKNKLIASMISLVFLWVWEPTSVILMLQQRYLFWHATRISRQAVEWNWWIVVWNKLLF